MVLCPGDLTSESMIEFLSGMGKTHVVRGNMDFLNLPDSLKVKLGDLQIGIVHGTVFPRGDVGQLSRIVDDLGVDVLISGHTHTSSVNEVRIGGKKRILLNPGSASGTWSGGAASMIPSFMIMEVENRKVIVHSYELVDGELKEKAHVFHL